MVRAGAARRCDRWAGCRMIRACHYKYRLVVLNELNKRFAVVESWPRGFVVSSALSHDTTNKNAPLSAASSTVIPDSGLRAVISSTGASRGSVVFMDGLVSGPGLRGRLAILNGSWSADFAAAEQRLTNPW